MLKQRNEQIQVLVRTADLMIAIVAFFVAYWIRASDVFFKDGNFGAHASWESLSWILAASVTAHLVLYPYFGFYGSLRLKSVSNILLMIARSALAEALVLGTLVFVLQEKSTSRLFFAIFLTTNYLLVAAEKLGARILLSSIRQRGYNFRQVVICGMGEGSRRLLETFSRNKHWGYVCAGILHTNDSESDVKIWEGQKVLGHLRDLQTVVQSRAVDEVYFALDRFDAQEVHGQVALCEKLGIPARFSFGMLDLPHSKVGFSQLDRLPILSFYTTAFTPASAFSKRLMDICVALLGLSITAVLYPWISWRIRRESPGPVIFKQRRVGENGRLFNCYKFRTMFLDAEARKQELMAQNQMQGPIFKIDKDPRITRFGAFLRATSLDELPQFLNILRGDMSVVGTRPPTPDEVAKYEVHYRRRLSVRPGLTGMWQVSGRNEIKKFEDILALDLQYIDHWSLWLDVRIIFKTIWVAFLGRRGAT